MIAVPPLRAELGIMLRFHACAVRAMERPVLVAHEPQLEALYPDCKRVIVEPRADQHRRWTYNHDLDVTETWRSRFTGYTVEMPDKNHRLPIQPFMPRAHVRQRTGGPAGIVLCPRKRVYGAEKNWDQWPAFAVGLRQRGARVFVAGLKDTSYQVASDERAWDYDRPLDATIEAMRNCSLVVATASGLSLLALLCGAPLLLLTSGGGLCAPGPSRSLDGTIHHDQYWKVPIKEYYHPLNHTGSHMEVMHNAWEKPAQALGYARQFV